MPERIRPDNPFSTRYTRPGALPFLPGGAAATISPEELAGRVLAHRRSCIVGPHGTGKTTLLANLRPYLDQRSETPSRLVTLRTDRRPAPELWRTWATVARGGAMIVDGYEQLGPLDRWRLIGRSRTGGVRLLVTAHHPPRGFHRLVDTTPSREAAWELATMLLEEFPEHRESLLSRFDDRWRAAGGNIRQLWATLYEDFEDQLPSSPR